NLCCFQDINQLEYFCKELYITTDPQIRTQAEKACSDLCKRADCADLCQLLLQRAHSCYSQLIAATALTKYILNRDAIIPIATRLEIRDYVLNYLAAHTSLEKFVQQSLITLLCRLTKAGWFDTADDGRGFRDILNCASKFIESGQSKAILIGVQLLSNLVQEMNQNSESDMTRIIFMQRKLSASFRDSLLLPIFRLGLNLLREADKNVASLDVNNADQVS
ncbi:Exportin-7, partial [Fasciolopsis buskii]